MADGFQRGVDKNVDGVNPCAEITAENGEPCNLFEVFPYMLDKEGIDYELALRLATRYAKRVTFSTYDWEVSRNAIQKNRRIGVSLSGQQDWMLYKFNGAVDYWETMSNGKYEFEKPVYKKEVAKTLDEMYTIVQKEDREYSKELQCEPSLKTTTVKPSGTVALLNGMSAGVHWHYSDFYIRRMRFQHDDPLLEVCMEAGYHIEPDVYSDRTSVVEFPVKTRTSLYPDFKTAGGKQGVSIEEQFAYQELIQKYWADNSVSCTVTFSKEEEEDIAPLLNYYKTRLKSTSMLPYEDHGYEQAPYEPISMSKYEDLMAELEVEPSQLFELQAEEADLELVGLDGCESGVCPIK
jgi:adenosylcobalamin-dependent ribonucleoside-triphosphate reductase